MPKQMNPGLKEASAREARNKYYREYRIKNREKIREINQRYWERRAAREQEIKADENQCN